MTTHDTATCPECSRLYGPTASYTAADPLTVTDDEPRTPLQPLERDTDLRGWIGLVMLLLAFVCGFFTARALA